jgi:tetratricopeptide (TPR) repeat protein
MHFRPAGFSLKARRLFSTGLALLAPPVFALPLSGTSPVAPVIVAQAAAPKVTGRVFAKKRGTKADAKNSAAAPGTVAPSEGAHRASSGQNGPPEFADVWASEFRPAPADLQLKTDAAHKAEAFAAFSQGLLAEDNADQDGMLAGYRRALELDPSYADLSVKVAYELARRNDVSGGIQILKDTIKAAPKEPLPYIYLSQLYSHYLKKPDIALNYAEQALALAPENFKSYLAIYELHDGSGQRAKADAILARAIKVESKDPRYWTELGEFLQKIYLKDDGSCTPEELKRMNAVYARLAELSQDDAVTLAKIADYYVLSKQVKEAIPRYLAVLKMRSDSDDPALGNVREKLARSLIFTGQRDEAITVLEEIVKQNPQRFDTYELLGELYEQKGDLDRAMALYEHILLLDSSEPRNHLRIADLLRQAKKYDKAVEMLEQARKKFPDLPFITYGLALALSQAKRHEESLAAFAQAQTDAENRNEELLNASFYFTYGAAAEQAGKLDKAAALLKQSIQLDPNAAQAYNYLGYMWADRGEHLDEAGNLIKKAVELDPDNGAYLDSLGWFYYKRGEAEKALKELLRAQENILREDKRDDAVVLDHIADTYSKLGKIPEALSYWQKAVALEQDDKSLIGKITEKIEAAKQKVTSGAPMPEPPKQ